MGKHPFDILDIESGGRLIFTPCPGTKGVSIHETIDQLKGAGADTVITLMTNEEMALHNVAEIPETCLNQDMDWFHFPIEDDQAPTADFDMKWINEKSKVLELLDSGKTLAIHCKGGSGRTGLMATLILREKNVGLADAMTQVKALRPNSLKLKPHVEYLNR